jgi:hypothetical protein
VKKVLILGCGPAGLMAAQAVAETGWLEPVIASKKRKSEMYGAQYLHAPIPGVDAGAPFEVEYVLRGTIGDYRNKVYGPAYRGNVSPEDLAESHMGWDIRQTYDTLWKRFQHAIVDVNFTSPQEASAFVLHSHAEGQFAHYISTIPAPLLCTDPSHGFSSQQVWAVGDAPERGIFSPIKVEENTVVCSGERDTSWYRASNILGYHTVEWPMNRKPPIEGISGVTKPLETNCTCLPFVHRAGRYGTWRKGVLSHEAYFETFHGLTAGGQDAEAVPTTEG